MSEDGPVALLDACVLVGPLKRNLLLSFAEAGLFAARWSPQVMDEAERAISKWIAGRGFADAADRAARTRGAMERAFVRAAVTGYEPLMAGLKGLPDPGDAHVIAAAIHARASVIVTDNIRHFPARAPWSLEARTADAFLANLAGGEAGRAAAAAERMRERFQRPERTPDALLLDMRATGLPLTADALRGRSLPP